MRTGHDKPGTKWLGRQRWMVERTLSWSVRLRQLTIRHERRVDIHLAFLTLVRAVI